jgi:hypothetical protein
MISLNGDIFLEAAHRTQLADLPQAAMQANFERWSSSQV